LVSAKQKSVSVIFDRGGRLAITQSIVNFIKPPESLNRKIILSGMTDGLEVSGDGQSSEVQIIKDGFYTPQRNAWLLSPLHIF